MKSYEFLRQDENGKTHIVIDTTKSDPTWWEIVDRFVDFINGCGFQVSWKDLRDYCDEQSWEPDPPMTADERNVMFDWNSMASPSPDFFESTTTKFKNDNSK